MIKSTVHIALAALLAMLTAGCAGILQPSAAKAEPAKPTLSDEAKAALARAEACAKAARAAYTFWIPAETALAKARTAASAMDSAAVIEQAGIVSELCRLGTQQAGYPSTEMK